jgi:hypothetical protein
VPTPYDGRVRFDNDAEPLHHVAVDDLDNPNWHGSWQHPSPGGFVPIEGDPVRVTLVDGARAGEVADARFAGTVEWWLEGFTPFGPA